MSIARKTAGGLGMGLLAAGLGVNPFTLAFFAPDGRITHPVIIGAILAVEGAVAGAGLYLLFKRNGAALINLALMLVSCVVAFGLCEFACRVYFFGFNAFSISKMNSFHNIGESGLLRPSEYQDLLFELKPDLDTYLKMVPLRTNHDGMRDQEYPKEKPKDVFRIAVVGDSFTLPDGIPIEEAYFKVLESKINEEHRTKRVECLNFGVSAYYLNQYPAVIRHKALAYEPDVILIGFCAENDHIPPPPELFAKPYVPKPASRPVFHSFLAQLFLWSLNPSHERLSKDPLPREAQYVDEQFKILAELGKTHSIPVIIAYLANIPRESHTVETIAAKYNLGFIDASRMFDVEKLTKFSIYHPIDSHPNARAQRRFARAIYSFLNSRKLLPPAAEAL